MMTTTRRVTITTTMMMMLCYKIILVLFAIQVNNPFCVLRLVNSEVIIANAKGLLHLLYIFVWLMVSMSLGCVLNSHHFPLPFRGNKHEWNNDVLSNFHKTLNAWTLGN